MHSLYFRRYSIKGPFTGLQKLLTYCAVDDGEERSSCTYDIVDGLTHLETNFDMEAVVTWIEYKGTTNINKKEHSMTKM